MKKVTLLQLLLFAGASVLFTTTSNAQNVAGAQATFQEFLKQFPAGQLPYSFGEQDLRTQLETRAGGEKTKRLAWEFYEFLPDLEENVRTNRMPVYPEPVVYFETKQYYAVVYNTGRKFARQFKTYNIAVFDKQGKYIASRCIAGVNPTALAAATIDEHLQVTIKEYSINWEKDYMTNGLDGNNIIGLTPTTTRTLDATTSTKNGIEEWNYRPAEITADPNLTADAK